MLLVLKLADIAPILRRMNLIFKLNGPCLFHCGCVFFLFWLRVFVFLFLFGAVGFCCFFWCWFSPLFCLIRRVHARVLHAGCSDVSMNVSDRHGFTAREALGSKKSGCVGLLLFGCIFFCLCFRFVFGFVLVLGFVWLWFWFALSRLLSTFLFCLFGCVRFRLFLLVWLCLFGWVGWFRFVLLLFVWFR